MNSLLPLLALSKSFIYSFSTAFPKFRCILVRSVKHCSQFPFSNLVRLYLAQISVLLLCRESAVSFRLNPQACSVHSRTCSVLLRSPSLSILPIAIQAMLCRRWWESGVGLFEICDLENYINKRRLSPREGLSLRQRQRDQESTGASEVESCTKPVFLSHSTSD